LYFTRESFFDVCRQAVMTPAMTAIWDDLGIGVAVVDANGICEYMNPIQRRVDGFGRINVAGQHITSLYVPHELECIPTIECLRTGEPILKKSYFYKTTKNYLAGTVSDFFPLFRKGQKDGVIAFTLWTGSRPIVEQTARRAAQARPAKTPAYYTFDSIAGQHEALREVLAEARAAAGSSSHVMIWGESGTGKEVFAQAIHSASSRSGQPLVAENCAAIPENLLEAILFGTEKGAYTDAPQKAGLLEEANGGTLILDELNSMPPGLQAKLLRVLQEKRVRRLGSHKEIPVDVRVISILNEAPLNAVGQGVLRSDLFYRLAVIGLAIPPLRERKSDIAMLARLFMDNAARHQQRPPVELDSKVLDMFMAYDWPGNVRELLHVIEGSIALLGDRTTIDAERLPRHFREAYAGRDTFRPVSHPAQPEQTLPLSAGQPAFYDYRDIRKTSVVPLKSCVQQYEAECIRNVLRVTGGNVAKAARIMQITGAGLRYKIQQLGIEDEYLA
jgi:arginine utilization regulatory protein